MSSEELQEYRRRFIKEIDKTLNDYPPEAWTTLMLGVLERISKGEK